MPLVRPGLPGLPLLNRRTHVPPDLLLGGRRTCLYETRIRQRESNCGGGMAAESNCGRDATAASRTPLAAVEHDDQPERVLPGLVDAAGR